MRSTSTRQAAHNSISGHTGEAEGFHPSEIGSSPMGCSKYTLENGIKIVNVYPPNIEQIRAAFPLQGGELFAYGDTIYHPCDYPLSMWIIAHEEVHQRQQGTDVEGWWDKYINDPAFRLDQELEAHRAEYRAFCHTQLDRNYRVRYLAEIARRLASPMYGSLITATEARTEITMAKHVRAKARRPVKTKKPKKR